MLNIEEVNKSIEKCPETVFDSFRVSIDLKSVGGALRDKLVELSNLYGRINQLSTNALFLYEKASNRRDRVEAIAWSLVPKEMKVTQQRIAVKSVSVEIDGEKTSLNEEEERVNLYSYLSNRGKDKVKEISTVLDIGRTLLSWDKTEQSKTQY